MTRLMQAFRDMHSQVPSRLLAIFLRTLLNGWCTGRRFQQRRHCAYCQAADVDSVEHYARCPAVHALTTPYLGTPRPPESLALAQFLGLHVPSSGDTLPSLPHRPGGWLGRWLACLYSLHAILNTQRHGVHFEADLAGAFATFWSRAWSSSSHY